MSYPSNDMSPQIENGDMITLTVINVGGFKEGDVVFCKIEKNHYIQSIAKITQYGNKLRYQICNRNNDIIGIIGIKSIFGKVTNVIKLEG